MTNVFPSRFLCALVPYVLIGYLYFYVILLQGHLSQIAIDQEKLARLNPNSEWSIGSRVGATAGQQKLALGSGSTGIINALKEKVRTLEMKLNAYLGYDSDPFYWTQVPATCMNMSRLEKFCPVGVHCDVIPICLDDFPYNDCTIYDFGIREQPEFGVILSRPPFNCQVYAFDPSPITKEWYAKNSELKRNKNYHMFHYGGGGADEEIALREYNWDQVSIYSYPTYVVANPRNCSDTFEGKCRYQKFEPQKIFMLPVRSVSSLMEEFGHKRVDILKLDVEGSEYRMLEGLIESGSCKNINQISLEWHHFDFDLRYGYSSVPHLNLYAKLLKEKCGLAQFWLHDNTGWPSNEELYIDMQLRLMYNLASYMRVKP